MSQENTKLGLLPLRNLVLFPGVILPIDVGRAGSLQLVEEVVRQKPSRLIVATQRDKEIESPGLEDLYPLAVEAEVLRVVKVSDSRYTLVVRGVVRRRIVGLSQKQPYLIAEVAAVEERNVSSAEADGLALSVKATVKKVVQRSP